MLAAFELLLLLSCCQHRALTSTRLGRHHRLSLKLLILLRGRRALLTWSAHVLLRRMLPGVRLTLVLLGLSFAIGIRGVRSQLLLVADCRGATARAAKHRSVLALQLVSMARGPLGVVLVRPVVLLRPLARHLGLRRATVDTRRCAERRHLLLEVLHSCLLVWHVDHHLLLTWAGAVTAARHLLLLALVHELQVVIEEHLLLEVLGDLVAVLALAVGLLVLWRALHLWLTEELRLVLVQHLALGHEALVAHALVLEWDLLHLVEAAGH